MYVFRVFSICFLLCLVGNVSPLENGLARLPPMGWMSWGYYMCADDCDKTPEKCLNERLILDVADAFYSEGFQEAGYEYIIIDDCWSERHRSWDGKLVPNAKRFPRGMKFLADYIHARGLKFGMYLNIAQDTCMRYPGSRGYFKNDAQQLADWDVDYVKVDGCFVEEPYLDVAYIKLGYFLNHTGRPMVYGCSWPYYKKYIHNHDPDYSQIVPVCNLWRNFHDVAINWGNVQWIMDFYEKNATLLQKYHGPGHWNDPDMLIIGTGGLDPGQSRIQLGVWAMLAAPLLISADMRRLTAYDKSLLLNLELIAIAQDPLGIMATPTKITEGVTVWWKMHHPIKGDAYPSHSFAVVNIRQTSYPVSIDLHRYGLNNTVDGYTVWDIFSKEAVKNVTVDDTLDFVVPPYDILIYTLFPL